MKKLLIAGSVAVAVAGITLVAGCGHHRMCRARKNMDKHAGRMVKRVSKKLELDNDQTIRLQSLKDKVLARRESMLVYREKLQAEVEKEFLAGNLDKAGIEALLDGQQEHVDEAKGFFVESLAEFHDILTPEQREKLVALAKKHHRKCGKH